MKPLITVLTIDDHPVFREGIAAVLSLEPDIELIGEAQTAAEGLQMYEKHRADVVLMDIQLPDFSGIEATAKICRRHPNAKVIMLTTYKGDVQALAALKAGASGFLLKNALRRELIDSIRAVHAGEQRVFEEVALELASHIGNPALTVREVDVLRCVAQGQSNRLIAQVLGIAEETVQTHMTNMLAKLEANDRTKAVMIGLRRGIIRI